MNLFSRENVLIFLRTISKQVLGAYIYKEIT